MIHLYAFDMAAPGHIQQGMWAHGRDTARHYTRLDHWTGLARLLERGLFDGLFLADVLGAYDVYGGSVGAALRGGVQLPMLDPMLLVPAMAAATTHLTFGITANTAYEPPYLFARRMSTLDHLTDGRIGWNVVTGYLDSAARAMGYAGQMAHDDRYDAAEEVLSLLYKLWEGSWADDAVRRQPGRYADPARVRAVHHDGPGHSVHAIHLAEPSPQRTPVLFQAGASPRGRAFAARHAECVFVNGSHPAVVAGLVRDLRARAAPRPLKVLAGATVIVGRTEREAQALLAEYAAAADREATLVHASASLGIDLARFAPDEPVMPRAGDSQAIQSNIAAIAAVAGPDWTVRDLLALSPLGSRQPPIVGTPAQVADALAAWVREADVDGFNLARTVVPECLESFIDLVVPVLQERGMFRTAYAPGTARAALFGAGDRLRAPHPAAAERF